MVPTRLGIRLGGFLSVATLPIGLLAAIFLGGQAALVVFTVGWLLLTPGSAGRTEEASETRADRDVELGRSLVHPEWLGL